MDAVFLKLLELSIVGSFFVLTVVVLRLIFRKAPKWVFCLLWGMVALRLVLPFSIESSVSLIPDNVSDKQIASQMAQSYVGDVTYIHEGTENYQAAVDAGRKPIQSGESAYVVTQKDSLEEPQTVKTAVLPVLSRIWFVGVAIMLGYTLMSYLALRRKVSTATLLQDNIKQSELVDSPFVLGLIRPVIYLPYGLNDTDLVNVVAHELAHIQRKDHWWKPIGFMILSVYWFNPVMWLAYILLCRDIEGACDEKVIKKLDIDGIRAYSTALLNCSIHRRSIAACPLAFGEVGVKERIKRVMHYKKPAFWIVLLALIASVVAAVLLLTSPKADEQLLMGAYYRVSQELYSVMGENAVRYDRFMITADYYFAQQQAGRNVWLSRQQMEPSDITAEELNALALEAEGWKMDYTISKITDAYWMEKEKNHFYIAVQTADGDTLMAFGSGDLTGEEPANPAKLLWLYQLETEFAGQSVDLDFVAHSLNGPIGIVEIIEVWESEKNPGFLVAGFLTGRNFSEVLGYDDMGYAVFQTNGIGHRLLNWKVYENAVYSENGIYICPDPVVLSLDGKMQEDVTFDLILSCNGDLDKILREYYRDDQLIHSIASMQMGSSSMHLFRWDTAGEADTVSQVFLGKDGKELAVKTAEETILELIDRIAQNPSVAESSNPYDYIKEKQELFDQILSYGNTALDCLVGHLRSTQDDGLKEHIVAAACVELTGIGKDKLTGYWYSGQSWLELYDGASNSSILGKYEEQIGASIGVDSLLGIDRVWLKYVDIQPHAYKQGVFYHSLRFYYHGDGKDYDTREQEKYLLEVHGCLDYRMKDFDGDGIVELFVCTDDADTPYELYDLNGTQIVVEKFNLVPDAVMDNEILFDKDEYYLWEERWAWFFKDPAAYVAEMAKRPEDRLYSVSPSGTIPAYTDTGLIDAAVARLHTLLDGMPTAYEKKIIYRLLNEIQLSYMPMLMPEGDFNYARLVEQWTYTSDMSTEAYNCLQQISDAFDNDSVAFLKGVAAIDQSTLLKDMRLMVSWLVQTNYLYDAEEFRTVLANLSANASGTAEKELASLFQEEFGAMQEPSYDTKTLAGGESAAIWQALFYDPDRALDVLGNCNEEQLKRLGQKLWGIENWARKLLDKGYAVVDRVLAENPEGTRKDIAYEFLLALEWEGNYSQKYIPGNTFDYQRLFEKTAYADGALATMCYGQMYDVFEADSESFMTALSQGDWDKENIALHFAHRYQSDEEYPKILDELLKNASLTECVQVFIAAYQNY